jgi:hypothetical protein
MLPPSDSSKASNADSKERDRDEYYNRNLERFLNLLSASQELEGFIPQIRELSSQKQGRRQGENIVKKNRSGNGNVDYEGLQVWKIVEKESGRRGARVLSFCQFVIDCLQDPNINEVTRKKLKGAVALAIMLAK